MPQEAVVDEDAVQAPADRALEQHRGDRAVDAAREPEHDLARVADRLAHLRDLALDDRAGLPVARQPAHAVEEVPQDLGAALRVADLGVELDTP